MAGLRISCCDFSDALSQALHGFKSRLIGKGFGWKRPLVAHRHGPESLRDLPVQRLHHAINVKKSDTIHAAPAKFVRRAIWEIFITHNNFFDPNVARLAL